MSNDPQDSSRHYSDTDCRWMRYALELACRGTGLASLNPQVGCVLIGPEGRAVGEGWHEYAQRDHAEIVALRHAGSRARGATAYVTLEPCSHTGRTGPCALSLIDAGVARVVVASADPNPLVAGDGIRMLREAGIEVKCGVLQEEAHRVNDSFARWIQNLLPFVTLKVAMTVDGRIAPTRSAMQQEQPQPYWITSEASRAEVQRMRHEADAVMTGIGTILADDPGLTDRSRLSRRRTLLRVVLDSALRIPLQSKIVQTAKDDVLLCTISRDESRIARLRHLGLRVEQFSPAADGRLPLDTVLELLGSEQILSVMTECGSALNSALLSGGHVDRLECFMAPWIFGDEARPAWNALAKPTVFPQSTWTRCGPDLRLRALLRDPWPYTLS